MNPILSLLVLLNLLCFLPSKSYSAEEDRSVKAPAGRIPDEMMKVADKEKITIAILAKDKSVTLPFYLDCIEKQTYPAHQINLYIRTNNNKDDTAEILKKWVKKVEARYAKIFFDDSNLKDPIEQFGPHEWSTLRLKVLGKIRQDSIDWAKEHKSHYFVVDCDNFILPQTLERIYNTHLPIVAPLLHKKDSNYANFHAATDPNGYYGDSPFYMPIQTQQIKGLIEVPVVHCAYFIRNENLDKISYDDNSERYEYVIFSDNARKKNIPQYIDNREVYGLLTFAVHPVDLVNEGFIEYATKFFGYPMPLKLPE